MEMLGSSIVFEWDAPTESYPSMKIQECDPFQMMLASHDMINNPQRLAFNDAGNDNTDTPSFAIIFDKLGVINYIVLNKGALIEQIIAAGHWLKLMAEQHMIEALMNIRAGQQKLAQQQEDKIIYLPPGVNPESVSNN